jgi:hypothetical protein
LSGRIAPERAEYCHGQWQRLWRTSQLFWEKNRFKANLQKKRTPLTSTCIKNKPSIHAMANYVERRQIAPEWAEDSLSPPFCPSTSMMRAGVVLDDDDDDDKG